MKKNFLILVLGITTSITYAQEYIVKVNVGKNTEKVYLQHIESRQKESSTLVDGVLLFKGNANGKVFAKVIDDKQQPIPVILNGNITVDLTNATAEGNEENKQLSNWNKKISEIQEKMDLLKKEDYRYRSKHINIPDSILKRIVSEYNELNKQLASSILTCCTENKDRLFPAYFLIQSYFLLPKSDIIRLADSKAVFMQTSMTKPIRKAVEGWRNQEVGRGFTDLEMSDTTGTKRKLSEFVGNGKYVLIDFWASWCGPCRTSMPAFKALYKKYHAKGFDIVGVSFDQKKKAWIDTINKLNLTWNHISDLKGWGCAAGEIYGINSIPATLLIGPDGKIVASGLHAEELENKLAEIYSK